MSKNKTKQSMSNAKYSVENYKNKIVTFLQLHDRKAMLAKDLATKCRSKRGNPENYNRAIDELRTNGTILMYKQNKVSLCSRMGYKKATITRLSKTFGFGITEDDGVQVFFPGKFLKGAMPQDKVLFQLIDSRSGDPEGEVLEILETGNAMLTGKVAFVEDNWYFIPDTMSKNHITISNKDKSINFSDGDKAIAEIVYRGKRHSEHKVKITSVFGDSETAKACSESILAFHGVVPEFSEDVKKEAKEISKAGIKEYDFNNREDFRQDIIFTIDSAESKDLDDAISVEKTSEGYRLGVHIADVSHYVKANSELDKEALNRGTSIYYANKVVPMLPKELSNGICSLNPNEDRLTLSAIIELDKDGEIMSYGFTKSVIRSRVKGIYSEINKILDGTETPEIAEKYAGVRENIFLMNELADLLMKRKSERHAPQIETIESKLIIDERDICVDVLPRTRGKSECIIEEFMLVANEASANLAKSRSIPFVYRIHENPPEEKIEKLKIVLEQFGISIPSFKNIKPVHLDEMLKNSKGTEIEEAINILVLRSMAKAKYSDEPLGHFGLALEDYAHFTSPIRRYPDLAIHRIITDILAGYDKKWINKRYAGFAHKASESSSNAEVRAVNIERECENCYTAEYMKDKIGDTFNGRISSVLDYGFYVRLENTIEGFIHIRTLPEGEYDYKEPTLLTETLTKKTYKLGDNVRVICAAVNVNDGNIDFVLQEEDNNA